MCIGIVGGVERNEAIYGEVAQRAGHSVRFHSGHLAGRGSDALDDLVRRVGLLVVITDVNSHGAVRLARKAARRYGVPVVLSRRFSAARLSALMAETAGA